MIFRVMLLYSLLALQTKKLCIFNNLIQDTITGGVYLRILLPLCIKIAISWAKLGFIDFYLFHIYIVITKWLQKFLPFKTIWSRLTIWTWFCLFKIYTYKAIIADLFPIENVQRWWTIWAALFFIQSMQEIYSGGEPIKAELFLIENVQE